MNTVRTLQLTTFYAKRFDKVRATIVSLINERCETGDNKMRLQQGGLSFYLWKKLGFNGKPMEQFGAYLEVLLMEDFGARRSSVSGKTCLYGIAWKGEKPEDWRHPRALDLPIYKNSVEKFVFRTTYEEGKQWAKEYADEVKALAAGRNGV